MTEHEPSSSPALALSGELTIYHVAAHFQVLREHIAAQRNVVLDLAAVEEIDSAGVQLLLLAKAQADAQGLPFALVAHSPAVDEALRLLFLKRALGLAEPTPAAENNA